MARIVVLGELGRRLGGCTLGARRSFASREGSSGSDSHAPGPCPTLRRIKRGKGELTGETNSSDVVHTIARTSSADGAQEADDASRPARRATRGTVVGAVAAAAKLQAQQMAGKVAPFDGHCWWCLAGDCIVREHDPDKCELRLMTDMNDLDPTPQATRSRVAQLSERRARARGRSQTSRTPEEQTEHRRTYNSLFVARKRQLEQEAKEKLRAHHSPTALLTHRPSVTPTLSPPLLYKL
jgi:hypothetical protein